jgi:hypothetical protein
MVASRDTRYDTPILCWRLHLRLWVWLEYLAARHACEKHLSLVVRGLVDNIVMLYRRYIYVYNTITIMGTFPYTFRPGVNSRQWKPLP